MKRFLEELLLIIGVLCPVIGKDTWIWIIIGFLCIVIGIILKFLKYPF